MINARSRLSIHPRTVYQKVRRVGSIRLLRISLEKLGGNKRRLLIKMKKQFRLHEHHRSFDIDINIVPISKK